MGSEIFPMNWKGGEKIIIIIMIKKSMPSAPWFAFQLLCLAQVWGTKGWDDFNEDAWRQSLYFSSSCCPSGNYLRHRAAALPASGQENRDVVMGMLRVRLRTRLFPQSISGAAKVWGKPLLLQLFRCFPVSHFHPHWYKMVRQKGVLPCLAQENVEAVGKMEFDFITRLKPKSLTKNHDL